MTALDGALRRSEQGEYRVVFDRQIDRPPARVWAALTDPPILSNWLGDVEVDLRVGGNYIIRFRKMSVVMTGRITSLEPGRLLEYTWQENYGMPASKIRWELSASEAGCRLHLSHRLHTRQCVEGNSWFPGGLAQVSGCASRRGRWSVRPVRGRAAGGRRIPSPLSGTVQHRLTGCVSSTARCQK